MRDDIEVRNHCSRWWANSDQSKREQQGQVTGAASTDPVAVSGYEITYCISVTASSFPCRAFSWMSRDYNYTNQVINITVHSDWKSYSSWQEHNDDWWLSGKWIFLWTVSHDNENIGKLEAGHTSPRPLDRLLHFVTLWPWPLTFWPNINWLARYRWLSLCQVLRF